MKEKLKEIAEHLKEWIACELEDGCGKCDEMRNIIKELTGIAEAMQPETTELEKILCAAIWYKDLPREIDARGFQPVNTDIGIVVTGYRHGNCIATVKELSGLRSVKLATDGVGELIQGFLTNKNRFVDRQEAMIIARKANQLINEDHTDTLFSEDLY